MFEILFYERPEDMCLGIYQMTGENTDGNYFHSIHFAFLLFEISYERVF